MKPLDRAIWIVGVLAIAFVVLYWPALVTAYKNRQTISAAADAASALGGLTK